MNPEIEKQLISLTKEKATPFYVFDLAKITNNYNFIINGLSQAKLFYALKANSEPGVLQHLNNLNSNFEVASKEELQKLIVLGVKAERIIFGNPVKKISDIEFASNYGVNYLVFDNLAEFNKIKKFAPKAKLILRINVSDFNQQINIDFGATKQDIEKMITAAPDLADQVYGLTFYGDIKPAIARCLELRQQFFPHLRLINIGGGFQPQDEQLDAHYFEEINNLMKSASHDYGLDFYVEPGLYIVNSSGYLVTKVLSSGFRNNYYFAYLDAGKPSGLVGENFEFEMLQSDPLAPSVPEVNFHGPTCDNFILFKRTKIVLPQLNDLLCFYNIGAYSICYANNFHSFTKPAVYYI